MKTTKKISAGRKTSFRPALEILEARDVPSAGNLDFTFGAGGIVTTDVGIDDRANAVAMQPDDKIVVVGSTFSALSGYDFALTRYNPDGTLDTSFSFDGKVTTDLVADNNDFASAVAIQGDGKIVVAGVFQTVGIPILALARYNPDGTLDLTFADHGRRVADDPFSAVGGMAIVDGTIVVAGTTFNAEYSNKDFIVARYNLDGSRDLTFGVNGYARTDFHGDDDNATALAVQSNGQLIVAGYAQTGTGEHGEIARYNADGSPDPTFQIQLAVDSAFKAVAIQNDGRVVAAGDTLLARFLPDGTSDHDFDGDGVAAVPGFLATGVAIQTDGKIIAVGGDPFVVARYQPDGSLDAKFGVGGEVATNIGTGAFPSAVTLQADGRIVVAGIDLNQQSDWDFALARYNTFNTFTLVKHADYLDVLGTVSADQLDVRDDGAGNITISSRAEDTAPFVLHGIHHIMIDTGNGDDSVTYQLGGLDSPLPAFHPADIDFDLGRGNDFLQVILDPSRLGRDTKFSAVLGAGDDNMLLICHGNQACDHKPDFQPALDFTVQGGAGNDTFFTFVGSRTDPESLPCPTCLTCIDARLMFNYQGDSGNDRFFTDVANVALDGSLNMITAGGGGDDLSQTTFDNVDVNAELSLVSDGGDGADTIGFATTWRVGAGVTTSVNLLGGRGGDTVEGQGAQHIAADGRSIYNLDGGDGDDSVAFTYVNAMVAGVLDATLDAGAGNDALTLTTQNVLVEGTASVKVHLGDGSDHMGFNNHDVTVAGTIALDVSGGSGNDTIEARAEPLILTGGLYRMQLSGDGGNDTLTANLLPAVQRGGMFLASLNGNDGNDTLVADVPPGPCAPGSLIDVFVRGGDGNDFIFVQVDLTGFTPESGRLHVAVEGGDRSDHMIFLVFGAERSMENALFTLDGGFGEDFALVSALVHVMNCEHVETI